jgi:hypothetical protein
VKMKSKIATIGNEIRTNRVAAVFAAAALLIAPKALGRGWGANREDKVLVGVFLANVHAHEAMKDPSAASKRKAYVREVMQDCHQIMSTFGKYSRQIAFFSGIGDCPPGKTAPELDELAEKLEQILAYGTDESELFRAWCREFWDDELWLDAIEGPGDDITVDEVVVAHYRTLKSGASCALSPEPVPEPALPSGYGDW